MNLPDYNFISAPLWLVTVLHIVTLSLHLIAMNFLFGGIIVLIFGKVTNKWENAVVQKFIKLFPNAMAATVSFGVAPLLFVQLVYAKQVYSASIVSGWFWLMIIVVAIITYYLLYASSFAKKTDGKQKVYLTIAMVGLLYISFVYSSVFSLAEKPDLYAALYAQNQSGLVLNTDIGSYLFRWLHMVFGAITVGGFFVGLLGRNDDEVFKLGKNFYLWGMVGSIATGFAYMLGLGEMLKPFMRSPGIWLVTVGFFLSLGSLHFMFKKKFLMSSIMLGVSFLSMVITRHVVRLLALEGFFDPSSLPVNPQWGIFIIFLILFVLMVAVVWYMLKLFFGPQET
ncbi:MAG: hypothetical protein DWP97_08370 [Calditrichaeota bacterium]|nr:MAG: hypothetical protein DWP97_08370 [Calditrichota bacterium]